MPREIVESVEVLQTGELILLLQGKGRSEYQHVYREGVGVYWDEKRHGFKSTELKEWSVPKWFTHIKKTALSGVGADLELSPRAKWLNVSPTDQSEIERVYAL